MFSIDFWMLKNHCSRHLAIPQIWYQGAVPKEAIEEQRLWWRHHADWGPSSTRYQRRSCHGDSMRELLQPHQGTFKQVCVLNFEKMQFLIILLKCVVIVIATDSPQQLIRHEVLAVTVQCVSVPQNTGRLRALIEPRPWSRHSQSFRD